jgi:hypothetical protein
MICNYLSCIVVRGNRSLQTNTLNRCSLSIINATAKYKKIHNTRFINAVDVDLLKFAIVRKCTRLSVNNNHKNTENIIFWFEKYKELLENTSELRPEMVLEQVCRLTGHTYITL